MNTVGRDEWEPLVLELDDMTITGQGMNPSFFEIASAHGNIRSFEEMLERYGEKNSSLANYFLENIREEELRICELLKQFEMEPIS